MNNKLFALELACGVAVIAAESAVQALELLIEYEGDDLIMAHGLDAGRFYMIGHTDECEVKIYRCN